MHKQGSHSDGNILKQQLPQQAQGEQPPSPAHAGILGNEEADRLAKEAALIIATTDTLGEVARAGMFWPRTNVPPHHPNAPHPHPCHQGNPHQPHPKGAHKEGTQ